MIIGILEADPVYPELRARFGNYPRMFAALFERVEMTEPFSFVTYDVEHEVYPEDLDECDGYLITGSKAGVNDDAGWIRRLEEFVQECDGARKPLVGICFGHQLIARALGGVVETASVGWGVGVHTWRVLAGAEYMRPQLDELSLLVSHKDQVVELPAGAELLASSDFCPVAMFRYGDHIFALQSHPEFVRDYARGMLDYRREILGEELYQTAMASMPNDTQEEIAGKWILNFFLGARGKESAHD